MESKNIIAGVIAITVSLLIVAGVMIPVLNEQTQTEKTFENGRLYYMTDLSEESVTYTFDGTTWTVDGETVSISVTDTTTVVAGDGFIVRANGQIRGSTVISPASITTMTVSADGITGEYVNSSNVTAAINISGSVYYCMVDEETDYVLCPYNAPIYMNGDSEILADGYSAVKSGAVSVFKIEGNINDGFTVTSQNTNVTVDNVECNYEAVTGYLDLYKVTSITFETTYDGETRTQTYSSYIVPAEVTAELSEHFNSAEIALINVLPLLVIIAIVLMAAGLMVFKRD